jgi:hypothetical protein
MMEQPGCARIPQIHETAVQLNRGSDFAYRYAYARSADTRLADDTGQDYLTFRRDGQTFIFALCDGVSQSFYGDLAARFLGDSLLAWVGDGLPANLNRVTIRSVLTEYLQALTPSATELVQQRPLPEDIPAMLRDVLEQKRGMGSESTFVCGRIDLPTPQFPQGRIVFAWMGDSRLRLWGPDGERSGDLGGEFKTEQRWSSRRGPVGGEPHVFVISLEQDGRRVLFGLMAYSDGLSSLDRRTRSPSNFALQDLIDQAGKAATSDDIAFLEVWLGPLPERVEALPLLAPQLLETALQAKHLRAAWRSVPGADRYEVKLRDGEAQTWKVNSTTWESPPLDPGRYQVQVRAVRDEEPGEWSEMWEVEAPVLAVPARPVVPTVPRPPVVTPPPPAPPPRRPAWPLWAAIAGGLILCLIGLLGVWVLPAGNQLRNLFFHPTDTLSPTVIPAATPTSIPTPAPTFISSPATTPSPTLTPTLTATLTPTIGPVPSSPLSTPMIEPTFAPSPTESPILTAPTAEIPTPTDTPAPGMP